MLRMKKNFQELLKTIISSSGLNLNKIWGYHFHPLPDSYRQWLLMYCFSRGCFFDLPKFYTPASFHSELFDQLGIKKFNNFWSEFDLCTCCTGFRGHSSYCFNSTIHHCLVHWEFFDQCLVAKNLNRFWNEFDLL